VKETEERDEHGELPSVLTNRRKSKLPPTAHDINLSRT